MSKGKTLSCCSVCYRKQGVGEGNGQREGTGTENAVKAREGLFALNWFQVYVHWQAMKCVAAEFYAISPFCKSSRM